MLLINLGCGLQVHPEWINIDHFPRAWLRHLPLLRHFAPASLPPNFVNHDLRRGIPFAEGQADAVYSSHLLEHLPLDSVTSFLRENRRVLKKDGVIRIVVPDLELAARRYLKALENCRAVGETGQLEFDWATILLLDQMVRTRGGGRMQEWLMEHRETEFVLSMQGIFKQIAQTSNHGRGRESVAILKSWLRRIHSSVPAGEVHRWMYDELSLVRMLKTSGFDFVKIVDPDDSSIPGWSHYHLDRRPDGTIHQPGSVYIEGTK